MVQNFRQLGISSGQNLPLPDCFNLKEGFNRFPAMKFHFQGADFKVKQNMLYFARYETICQLTIIEAYQLQNTRLIYDVAQKKILFGQENCASHAF